MAKKFEPSKICNNCVWQVVSVKETKSQIVTTYKCAVCDKVNVLKKYKPTKKREFFR